jgi:hypothetical protein
LVEVNRFRIDNSPDREDFIRLSAWVRYRAWFAPSEILWFDLPRELAAEVGSTGDAWLVSLLPLALTLQERIALVGLPVDSLLLDNMSRLMAIWSAWYPGLSPVPIEAEVIQSGPAKRNRRRAAFFSGGVDSFYTLLRNQAQGLELIDDLIFLHGADIPIHNSAACQTAYRGAQRAASSFGLSVVLIATNLRSTRFRLTDWNLLGFGAMMAGAALHLQARYASCLIPSSGYTGRHPPHASHPEVDPLFSTGHLSFLRDGSGINRIEKTRFIARFPLALENLRVCWESKAGDNCGRCGKCLRTMATLEAIGKLQDCPAFPKGAFSPDALGRLYLSDTLPFMLDVEVLAIRQGRLDIAGAIDDAARRSQWLGRWPLGTIRWLRGKLAHRAWARQDLGWLYRWVRQVGIWLSHYLP